MRNAVIRGVVFLASVAFLGGCAAAREELRPTAGSEQQAPNEARLAQADQFEKELKEWDGKIVDLKAQTVGAGSEERFKARTKAIDDMEAQMKEARLHIRELRTAQNASQETERRADVLGNLATVEKIYRQMKSE